MKLTDTIGNTPLIEISPNLFAKLEGQNPGGSIKDRVALYMIEQAEARGELVAGQTIVEATSGNMGIALAMIGAQKGYPVKIVMSEGMSDERKSMIRSLGAELVLTDRSLGTNGAIRRARQLIDDYPDRYWFADQFNNPDNVRAHYSWTAPEILRDLYPDVLVAGIGTSGTIMGLASRFREDSPKTKIIGVLPPSGYKIQGIQNPLEDFSGHIYRAGLIDELVPLSVDEAYEGARELARNGIFVGMSSGAVYHVAKQQQGRVVAIFADRGEKYLSTPLYDLL